MELRPDSPLARAIMTGTELDEAGLTERKRRTLAADACLISPAKGYHAPAHPDPRCMKPRHAEYLAPFFAVPIDPASPPALRSSILRSLCLARRHGTDAIVSGLGAAALYGFPVILPVRPSELPHSQLTCPGARASHHAGDRQHSLPIAPNDSVTVDGISLTSQLRTLSDVAVLDSPVSGLAIADALLRSKLFTPDTLAAAISTHPLIRADGPALEIAGFASPYAESPGESWCRLELHRAGLPAPFEQVHIRDRDWQFVGRVDFAWPEQGVILEFDGLGKYRGPDGAKVLEEEKHREIRLQELGWIVIRCLWQNLSHFGPIAERIRHELGRRRARVRGVAFSAGFEPLI